VRPLTAVALAAFPGQAAELPLAVQVVAIAAATLLSEDAACIGTGLLVAQGRIDFAAGAFACFAGIVAGDLLLFGAGRLVGSALLERPALHRWLGPHAVARASSWLECRGPAVVLLSRFTPGMRLPTYFAAGLLGVNARAFASWLVVAAALWAPAVVAVAVRAGTRSPGSRGGLFAAASAGLLVLVATRSLPFLLTHRGRRLAIGRWRRFRNWEFWPLPVFYAPIAAYVAWLALKHRSLTLPTAVNPAIPGGGFAGESKIDILRALSASREAALRATRVPAGPLAERVGAAERFLRREKLAYPVVVKPDLGERGLGVVFVRSAAELRAALAASDVDAIVQEMAPGHEFGIFYVRHPDDDRGRIFSITEKVLPSVRGDGRRTLEQLILDDERAVCMARCHLERFADRLDTVPAAGEDVRLVDVGTHSRGAIFRDAAWARTPALEAAVDAISRRWEGFHFGRYDVRVERVEDLVAGRGFKIVELNGLTAEATHIYHPGTALRAAYRVLFEQWRIAFEIGRANRDRGFAPASLPELARLVRRARRARRSAEA